MLFFLNLYSLYCSNSDIEESVQYQSFIPDRTIGAVNGSLLIYSNEKEEVSSRTLKNLRCFVYDRETGAESLKNVLSEEIFDTLENFKSGTIISFELENITFEEELEYKIEIFDKITEKNLILKLLAKDFKKITNPLNRTNSVDLTSEAKSEDSENEEFAEIEVEFIKKKKNHGKGKKNETKWKRKAYYQENSTDSSPESPDTKKQKKSDIHDYYVLIIYSIIFCIISAAIYFMLCCVPMMSIVKSIFGKN